MARRHTIRIDTSPVASRYASASGRIIEFDSPSGGGLIAFRMQDDGTLTVEPYRLDETVKVRLATPKHYTITADDVGEPLIHAWGRPWLVSGFLGRVLPGDVGKRVYRVPTDAGDSHVLQVENDAQRDARTGGRP
jgi:hypothetical protein